MVLSKFLDPKNDAAFKRIFGTDKNKDILIHFLNDMVAFKEKEPIVDVTFLKTIQDPEIAAQKTSVVDVLCKDEKGNHYIVELQVAKEKGFVKRAQYYAAKAYSSQMLAGGAYEDLKEIIFIAIADFTMFPEKEAFKSDHIILDRKTYENDLKDFSFTFLELPKFKKKREDLETLKTLTEKWVYFFKYAAETREQDIDKLKGVDISIKRAYEELNRFSWNEEDLRIYDQAEKYAYTYKASMDQKYDEGLEKGLQQGLEKGITKGREEGLQEGLEKGITKGREEGLQEGLEKGREKGKEEGLQEGLEKGHYEARKVMVINSLQKGLDAEMIASLTGFSLEEIQKIQKSS